MQATSLVKLVSLYKKKTKEWKSSSDVDWKDTSVINLLFHRLIIWRQVFWTLDIYITEIKFCYLSIYIFISVRMLIIYYFERRKWSTQFHYFSLELLLLLGLFFVFKTIDRWYHRSFFSSLWHTPHIYI